MADRRNLADDWPPLRSLADLALRHWHVKLTCPSCGHVRVLGGAALWYLFYQRRWSDELVDVKRRLYCAYCQVTQRQKIRPFIDKTHDAPTGQKLPDPTMYEWKKLVARYRS